MQFSIHQFSSGIQNPTKKQKSEWGWGGFGVGGGPAKSSLFLMCFLIFLFCGSHMRQ